MIRKSLFTAVALGFALLSISSTSADSLSPGSPTASPTYWCVFRCDDGTEGGGPVSSGAECQEFSNSQCRRHGGTRMWGLDAYTPPSPYWCSIWCADGTVGGGPVSSGVECDALGN